MENITIKDYQRILKSTEFQYHDINNIFYKLSEEFGELAEAIRKDKRMKESSIKGTVEEELSDVLHYLFRLANEYNIDLEQCIFLKEKLNAEKYNRKNMFEDTNV